MSLRVPSTVLRGAKLDNSLRGRRLLLRWVPLFVHPRVTDEDERENGYSNKSQLGCHVSVTLYD